MAEALRLLAVLAHPDDESLGFGGVLAKYAAEGVETFVVTATRGEKGRYGTGRHPPDGDLVGKVREAELRAAAQELGVRSVQVLPYRDQELDQAPPAEIIGRIAEEIGKVRPHVVATFAPDGAYGHPDHIAISQFTTAALASADAGHRVSKLYYLAWDAQKWDLYQAAFKKLVSKVDGVERQATPWPDWAITTSIDAGDYAGAVWRAVQCHRTQMEVYGSLERLSAEQHRELWGSQQFYRAFSLVNGGRMRERDLFEGLR